MAARAPERISVWLALALAGCAAPVMLDDASVTDAGPLALELGTGEHAFTAIADGDTLLLARGCQGLQHVWIALRATGIAPRGVGVHLELTRDSDGGLVSAPFDTAITFTPDATGAFVELTGLMLVIPTPDAGLVQPLVLRGIVTDRAGRTTGAMRSVTLAWGTGVCGA